MPLLPDELLFNGLGCRQGKTGRDAEAEKEEEGHSVADTNEEAANIGHGIPGDWHWRADADQDS